MRRRGIVERIVRDARVLCGGRAPKRAARDDVVCGGAAVVPARGETEKDIGAHRRVRVPARGVDAHVARVDGGVEESSSPWCFGQC